MTRSKVDLATHLLKLCNDTTTKPEDLANVMTIRKLHYEIEKALFSNLVLYELNQNLFF